MRGRLPSCAVIFRPVRCGLRYVRQFSILPGAAYAAVFHSARRSMRGILPFYPVRHSRRSSVPPGAAFAEVFRSVWCGPVCAAVLCSAWRSTRGVLPFCLAQPGVCGDVPFCPAWHRCSVLSSAALCARRSSVLHGLTRAAFFRSARRGMRGVFQFRPGRHAWRSPVPPGAAYTAVFRSVWRSPVCVAVFRSVWRGPVCTAVVRSARRGTRGVLPFCSAWDARRSSVLSGTACAAVSRSARCGIRGGVPFCLARPGMLGSVPFCLALPGLRGGPPFSPARHTWRSSIRLGAACTSFFRSARGSTRGGLLFRLVRHTWRCSVLSGKARYARRCCRSVIGGPGSLVVQPDDPVIISASDPRSRRCSRHAAQRCVKVGQGR